MPDLESVIAAAIAPASAAAAAAEGATPAEPVETPAAEPVETPVEEPAAEPAKVADTPAEPVEKEGVKPPVDPATLPVEPVDEFAKEHGIKAKDSAGRENRIPYSAVKRINENAVKKATAALTETHTATLAEHTGKITEYETRLQRVAEVETMMFEDQARFVEILRTLPGYAELLGPAKPAEAPLGDTPPPPDVDGGYTPEGLQKLLDWHTKKAAQTAAAQAEERIAKRYAPIEKEHKQREQDAAFEAEMGPKIHAQLAYARENWLGYAENEAEIQKAYLADKKLTLEAAWSKVMKPLLAGEKEKLTTDRAKIRAEVLAEIAAAPAGTSVVPGAAPTQAARVPAVDPNKPVDLEEIIRQSIRKK